MGSGTQNVNDELKTNRLWFALSSNKGLLMYTFFAAYQ